MSKGIKRNCRLWIFGVMQRWNFYLHFDSKTQDMHQEFKQVILIMEKDIRDYLIEQKQLQDKIREFESKINLSSQEQVIMEELLNRLSTVEKRILKLSGK